jgi:transmembrane sensor
MTRLPDWLGENIPDVVMEDAATWMALLDSERSTEADRIGFARWLDEDPTHRWALEELSEVWARLRTLSDIEPLLDEDKVVRLPSATPSVPHAEKSSLPAQHRDWSAAAAIAIVALGVSAHMALSPASESFATDVGESRSIVLTDGSMLEMNSRTTMEIVIDDQKREVQLTSGEALFHVADDPRPFVVATDLGSVAALGTVFTVDVSNDVLEVFVIEGNVAVTASDAPLPLTEYDNDIGVRFASKAALLGEGEWLEVSGSNYKQQLLGTEEFRKRLSWRKGVVEFENQPLQVVVQEMRRYTHVSIHVADSELSNLRISGRFETGNEREFLTQLSEKYNIVVDSQNADWILLRSL